MSQLHLTRRTATLATLSMLAVGRASAAETQLPRRTTTVHAIQTWRRSTPNATPR